MQINFGRHLCESLLEGDKAAISKACAQCPGRHLSNIVLQCMGRPDAVVPLD